MLNVLLLSEINCVSDNTCTFLPKLRRLPLLPYLPQKSCMLMYVCVCMYSGVLLYYATVICCNVIELGRMVCVGKHAVIRCGVDVYVLKVAC